MKEYSYTVIVMPSRSGRGYRAVCPQVPECVGRGETKKEALRKLEAKLDRRLDRMIAGGQRICDPHCCSRPLQ